MMKKVLMGWGLMILVVCFVMKVFYHIWWKPKKLERLLRKQGIPGTPFRLIVGDINDIKHLIMESWSKPMPFGHQIAERINPFIYQMIHNHGKISFYWNESCPRVIVADPSLVKEIFIDKNGHYHKPKFNPLTNLLTLGLSTLEGQKWVKRRKLMNLAFLHEKIEGMHPIFKECCERMIKKWKERVGESSGGAEIDVAREFQHLAGEIIIVGAFGTNLEEGLKLIDTQQELVALCMVALNSIYIPGQRFLPTAINNNLYKLNKKLRNGIKSMIKRKELGIENGEASGDDLLGLLMRSQEEKLTIEDLIEECKLFYFAGQDTTYCLLTWTIVLLAMHPIWQDKAREEVVQMCGNNPPNFKSINQFKIVTMILNEALRLYPPIINQFRYTIKETKLGSLTIPAGVEIYIPTLVMQHEAEHWGEDVGEFNPERFAKGVSNAAKDEHNVAFFPFGGGPRICLGINFAFLEAKLALAMVLQNFWFELSPTYTHAPITIVSLQPQHGAPIIFHHLD